MADKGIIFSAPMVRALRDGRKTQTRRIVNVQRYAEQLTGYSSTGRLRDYYGDGRLGLEFISDKCGLWDSESNPNGRSSWIVPVPYRPGDRLYVRENWRVSPDACEGWHPDEMLGWIDYQAGGSCEMVAPSYEAVERAAFLKTESLDWDFIPSRWRPCLHMPRWASRLWLSVTDVRVQRVSEISEEDAIAEGIGLYKVSESDPYANLYTVDLPDGRRPTSTHARPIFERLWNSLHTKPGERWEDSPWIVAISFTVNHGNIDGAPRPNPTTKPRIFQRRK